MAIPLPTVERVVGVLLAHGRILRAYIGVGSQLARLPEALAEQLGQPTGLLVVSVEPDGPAAKGGLFLGDTLVALDDKPLKHLDDLLESLDGDKIDQPLAVRLVRGGQLHDVTVTPSSRPNRSSPNNSARSSEG